MLANTQKSALTARTAGFGALRPLPVVSRVQRCVIADAALKDTPYSAVIEKGEFVQFPEEPAVYAVYNQDKEVQYIGLTRKINVTISNHLRDIPEFTGSWSVKYELMADAGRDQMTAAWKAWMEESSNAPGATKFQSRSVRPKADIKLTAGKAINVPIETLIDQVVKQNKVVAFVKGGRSQPQCGFSYKMLTILNDLRTDYEVVNVLDDFHNPGLREAIKEYSQWPTIPQLYVSGEFVGGSDIVEQMQASGELQELIKSAAVAQPAAAAK